MITVESLVSINIYFKIYPRKGKLYNNIFVNCYNLITLTFANHEINHEIIDSQNRVYRHRLLVEHLRFAYKPMILHFYGHYEQFYNSYKSLISYKMYIKLTSVSHFILICSLKLL